MAGTGRLESERMGTMVEMIRSTASHQAEGYVLDHLSPSSNNSSTKTQQ
jgi:hypothetical protein